MQARKPATQAYLIHDRDSFFARRKFIALPACDGGPPGYS